jgi:hypothetical protein
LQPITKTFTRKTDAHTWVRRIEGDDEHCRVLGKRSASGEGGLPAPLTSGGK